MRSSALALALALSVGGSACALHPVAEPGYDPYYASGGERAAYEYEQRRAWEQQRAYEHAAARQRHAERRAWEHERRERARWEHERAVRATHDRSWDRHAQRERDMAHVTGYGARSAPSRVVVQPAPLPRPQERARVAPRGPDVHRSVARPQ